jgi:hypothetical protein
MNQFSGKIFNKQHKKMEFYLIFNEFKLDNSLSIFNFIAKNKIHLWISPSAKYLCKIIIPNDAKVCIEENFFTSDKITLDLDNLILTENFKGWISNNFCKKAITHNGSNLQFVKKQTYELRKIAQEQNVLALKFFQEKTCKLQNLEIIHRVDNIHEDDINIFNQNKFVLESI